MASIRKKANFTTTGQSEAVAAPGNVPFHKYALTLAAGPGGGTVTSFTCALEGSLDGVNWTALGLSITTPLGVTAWVTEKPCFFYRINLSALTLGTATSVDVIAVGKGD